MGTISVRHVHGGFRVTHEGVCVANAGPFDSPATLTYTKDYYTDERAAKQAAVEAGEATIKRIQANVAANKKWLREHPLPGTTVPTPLYGVGDQVKLTGGALDGAIGIIAGLVKHGTEYMYLVDVPGSASGIWLYKEGLQAPSDAAKVKAAVKAGSFENGDVVKPKDGSGKPAKIVATKEKKGHQLHQLEGSERWWFARQLEAVA